MLNHIFKTTIDKTEIVARANYLDHITSINIKTQLSSGVFASDTVKKKQLSTHIKCYVMAVASLINLEPLEFKMVIDNMFRTIPYTGKGIISEQHKIPNGWEVSIKIPISDFETRLYEFNGNGSKWKQIPPIATFDTMFNAESFVFNLNRNVQILDPNSPKITEVNIGEKDGTPLMLVQFSGNTYNSFAFLELESNYKHLTSFHLIKAKDESISAFTQKELAALLCIIPDQLSAAEALLNNFIDEEIKMPVTNNGITKEIKIIQQFDPQYYIFEIHGRR